MTLGIENLRTDMGDLRPLVAERWPGSGPWTALAQEYAMSRGAPTGQKVRFLGGAPILHER